MKAPTARWVFVVLAELMVSLPLAASGTDAWTSTLILAKQCQHQGRYKEAIAHSLACIQIAEQDLSSNPGKLGDSYGLHAEICHDLARYQEAKVYYHKSLECLHKIQPVPWQKKCFLFNNLATLFVDLGAYKDADDCFNAALAILKAETLPIHCLGIWLNNVAVARKSQGRFLEAYQLYKTAHKLLETNESADNVLLAQSFNNLANILLELNDLDAAGQQIQAFETLLETRIGQNYPLKSRLLHTRSKLLECRKSYDEAERVCKEAIQLSEQSYGSVHPFTAASWKTLASIQTKRVSADAARASFEKAIELYKQAYAVQRHPRIAEVIVGLGDLYVVLGDYRRSDECFTNALEMMREFFASDQHVRMRQVQARREIMLKEAGERGIHFRR